MTDQEIDNEIDKLQASYEKAMKLPIDTEKQIEMRFHPEILKRNS
jgi:hypothetical protein